MYRYSAAVFFICLCGATTVIQRSGLGWQYATVVSHEMGQSTSISVYGLFF